MEDRRVGRTAKNLLLALVNATLILAIICLWFAFRVLSAAGEVSARLDSAAAQVVPLRDDIHALTEEVAGARADLADLREAGAEAAAPGLAARLDRIEGQLDRLTGALAAVQEDPEVLIDRAVDRAFDELRGIVAQIVALRRGDAG